MTVIGLTGGIASGKSTVSQLLASKGARVIDADKLGHNVYAAGTEAFQQVVETFGSDVVGSDGEVDRRVLGGKVFGDPAQLKKLTDIAWPAIKKMATAEIETQKEQSIVLEAAVLLEAEWTDIVDEVWVVTVEPEVAIKRTIERDGLDRDAVQKRLDAQLSNAERIAQADVVIDNSGTLEQLEGVLQTEFEKFNVRGEK